MVTDCNATCSLLHTACYVLLLTCYLPIATCYLLLATYFLPLATCFLLLATFYLILILGGDLSSLYFLRVGWWLVLKLNLMVTQPLTESELGLGMSLVKSLVLGLKARKIFMNHGSHYCFDSKIDFQGTPKYLSEDKNKRNTMNHCYYSLTLLHNFLFPDFSFSQSWQ